METTTEMPRVRRSAQDVLAEMEKEAGVSLSAPINVDLIAKHLGIKVIDKFFDGAPDIVGQISFDGDVPVIEINASQNSYGPRRRFTLAHEIGHYCLHAEGAATFVDTKQKMSRSETFWDVHEAQANGFAAELLMPRKLILTEGKKFLDSMIAKGVDLNSTSFEVFTDYMARKFEVSNAAMAYRLTNLGIIRG